MVLKSGLRIKFAASSCNVVPSCGIEADMLVRRIFAGLITALMLSALSLGAACEVSCSFAQSGSDCHSLPAMNPDSDHAGAPMSGMDMSMDSVSMPSMANVMRNSDFPRNILPIAHHPTIGQMGPCERQSCDDPSVTSVRSSRSIASQLHALLLVGVMPHAAVTPAVSHDARDDISSYHVLDASPPALSLRI
jgi:hypothetical protein